MNQFRSTNAADYLKEDQDFQYFPEGIQVAKVIHCKTNKDRYKTMFAMGKQQLALNPEMTPEHLYAYIVGVFTQKNSTPPGLK